MIRQDVRMPLVIVSNAVPGFLPSSDGLHFANRFEPGPTVRFGILDPRLIGVGDASAGLCGGMAWFVREWFEAGRPIPADTTPPANGTPLFRVIVRRHVRSLDWLRGPWQFWRAAALGGKGLGERSIDTVDPRVRAAIDAGRLVLLGLIRHRGPNPFDLAGDHTVLAYGYDRDIGRGETTFRIYDPNWPDRDDVTITLARDRLVQSTGEPLHGIIALG